MKVQELNAYTQATYSFGVFDWDNDRGGPDAVLRGKHEFPPSLQTPAMAARCQIVCENDDLAGKSVEEIAAIFHRIVKPYQQVAISKINVHLRLAQGDEIPTNGAFLFIVQRSIQ